MSFSKFCKSPTNFSVSLIWQFVIDCFMFVVEFGNMILKPKYCRMVST